MKFKGKSFIAIVLSPEKPYSDWLTEIDRIIVRSPGFFIDRPIILDVRGSKIPVDELETLLSELDTRSVRVMGIDGVAGKRLKPGMPPSFSGGRLTADVDVPAPEANETPQSAPQEEATPPATTAKKANAQVVNSDTALKADLGDAALEEKVPKKPAPSKSSKSGNSIVITEHVRSGQSILHPEGDVTVIGSVSSGAEVIAGGSIHIYGALRGRALAGVSGKETARIFCSKLDAELVSINGLYKVADDFDRTFHNGPAQIRFENEALVFEELS